MLYRDAAFENSSLMDLRDFSGDKLALRVTPKAASDRIKIETQEDGTLLARVFITTVPEDGKANKAVIELLAKALGVSKSSLLIVQGTKSKDKLIQITR